MIRQWKKHRAAVSHWKACHHFRFRKVTKVTGSGCMVPCFDANAKRGMGPLVRLRRAEDVIGLAIVHRATGRTWAGQWSRGIIEGQIRAALSLFRTVTAEEQICPSSSTPFGLPIAIRLQPVRDGVRLPRCGCERNSVTVADKLLRAPPARVDSRAPSAAASSARPSYEHDRHRDAAVRQRLGLVGGHGGAHCRDRHLDVDAAGLFKN